MAWADSTRFFRKPSRVLGFLLLVVIFSMILFLLWERTGLLLGHFQVVPLGIFKPEQYAVIVAAVAAIAGWVTTSIVAIRSSVKQHTMTTLLQSRLSTTYMEHAKIVNLAFCKGELLIPLTSKEIKNPPANVNLYSLGYIVNYLEFVAVGIRNWDLDERVMKSSLRGILCSIYAVAEVLIQERRAAQGGSAPAVYENLVWLFNRWDQPELRQKTMVREQPSEGNNTLAASPNPIATPAPSAQTPTSSPK